MTTGTVYLVGAGPGDPDLLTLRALRVLEAAEVVLYDRLVGGGVIDLLPQGVRRIPVGKAPGASPDTQDRILQALLIHARRGRRVVRLKGGDPFVLGRGGEEWEYLREHDIPVEVVPGVTSALAVPGAAGVPLTHRGISSSFAVVAGCGTGGPTRDWSRYASIDTLVVLMGVSHRSTIAAGLIAAGRAATEPAAFIQRGTTADEETLVTSLEEIARGETRVQSPAVLVIGDVVRLRARLLPSPQEDVLAAAGGDSCFHDARPWLGSL